MRHARTIPPNIQRSHFNLDQVIALIIIGTEKCIKIVQCDEMSFVNLIVTLLDVSDEPMSSFIHI